ncbi:MAG: sigma-70 family RNA polymerase sigma factor [Pseudomonadales bacterium]|nr:sigma-70 family RNA polymerase sigma factor [Pseudomonadales bacterium]
MTNFIVRDTHTIRTIGPKESKSIVASSLTFWAFVALDACRTLAVADIFSRFRATETRLTASNMSMSDELSLLNEVRTGKDKAFERLILRYQPLVLHIVGRLVDNPEDVRDLCQEVFLRVHGKLHQFRGESSLATWIGSIAFSIGAAWLRKKRIPMLEAHAFEGDIDELIHDQPDPVCLHESLVDEESVAQLHKAIASLPPLQRTIITLYYLDETSIRSIAEITALPAGTVKSHLFRARIRLRQAFTQILDTQ